MEIKYLFSSFAAPGPRVFFDTCIFVYYFQNSPTYADLVENMMMLLEERKSEIYISTILFAELFVPACGAEMADAYENWLSYFHKADVRIVPVAEAMGLRAAQLRWKYGFKTPDSIHLATAIESGCDLFIGNDRRLKQVKEIKVLCLSEMK